MGKIKQSIYEYDTQYYWDEKIAIHGEYPDMGSSGPEVAFKAGVGSIGLNGYLGNLALGVLFQKRLVFSSKVPLCKDYEDLKKQSVLTANIGLYF